MLKHSQPESDNIEDILKQLEETTEVREIEEESEFLGSASDSFFQRSIETELDPSWIPSDLNANHLNRKDIVKVTNPKSYHSGYVNRVGVVEDIMLNRANDNSLFSNSNVVVTIIMPLGNNEVEWNSFRVGELSLDKKASTWYLPGKPVLAFTFTDENMGVGSLVETPSEGSAVVKLLSSYTYRDDGQEKVRDSSITPIVLPTSLFPNIPDIENLSLSATEDVSSLLSDFHIGDTVKIVFSYNKEDWNKKGWVYLIEEDEEYPISIWIPSERSVKVGKPTYFSILAHSPFKEGDVVLFYRGNLMYMGKVLSIEGYGECSNIKIRGIDKEYRDKELDIWVLNILPLNFLGEESINR